MKLIDDPESVGHASRLGFPILPFFERRTARFNKRRLDEVEMGKAFDLVQDESHRLALPRAEDGLYGIRADGDWHSANSQDY
jgi:hypothetical protein